MAGRTLEGRVVLVTRARERARRLAKMLEDRGATAIVAPAIELAEASARALDGAIEELMSGAFEWVVFTSRAGVKSLVDRLEAKGWEGRTVGAKVAAVGDSTARALREAGMEPDVVPDTFTTFALSRAMPRGRGRVLLARADIASGELEGALATKGWTPVRVDAYRTRLADEMPDEAARALRAGEVDAVTFTSSSTVHGFLRMVRAARLDRLPEPAPKIVCIGPVTARAARDASLPVDAVASPHTIGGLVQALERVLGGSVRPKEES